MLWAKPLEERRLALAAIMRPGSAILLSEEYAGDGADLFRLACEQDYLEGIVSKRLDKPYRGGRSQAWLKTKCVATGEFVIVGFVPGSGPRRATGIANLQLASFDGHALRYAGAVGTGFSEAVTAMLRARLAAFIAERCALAGVRVKGAVWVAPDMRAEVAYRGTTTSGELRHASFRGLSAPI